MIDLTTLTRLYDEMCALWTANRTASMPTMTEAYNAACDLFLAHGRYLQSKAAGHDASLLEGQLLRWSQDAPRWHHERECGKIGYVSRKQANLEAKRVESQKGGRHDAYRCRRCDQWHLTSTSRRDFKKRVAEFGAGQAGPGDAGNSDRI